MLVSVSVNQDWSSYMSGEDYTLQKTFRYLEWIALALVALQQATWLCNSVEYHQLIGLSCALLVLSALLAVIMPKSQRWRFNHLMLQSAVISVAWALGAPKRSSLYFLVLGAKAASLLPRGQMIFVAVILVVERIASGMFSQYLAIHIYSHHARDDKFYAQFMPEAESKLFFIAGLVTVLFLGRTLVAARKSRLAQHALAREAESLAVDLERNRIASDINASLGQTLASQLIQLELASKLVQDNSLDKARDLVTQSLDSAVHCLQELRRAVKAIRTKEEKIGPLDRPTSVDAST